MTHTEVDVTKITVEDFNRLLKEAALFFSPGNGHYINESGTHFRVDDFMERDETTKYHLIPVQFGKLLKAVKKEETLLLAIILTN